ncbi:hypothetical protein DAPPUDRAFT_99396 [Daphnia pulex]|uniref:Uncharacterized protein n=1 Tax=Daphnia pulex TaxID=6669 RepID=E9G806_DAPPU|nr:hypothetical protein DAPPUDRAFT_99396 [Daphnia pulex]|eukprot:EFX84771.1 hypothetical protein DAPPUDRAFT_99396 [Daphnia pulex]
MVKPPHTCLVTLFHMYLVVLCGLITLVALHSQASPSFAKLRQASPSFAKLYLALALKKNQKKIKNTALASWNQWPAQHRTPSFAKLRQASPSFAKLRQASPSFAKLRQASPSFAKLRQASPSFAKLRQASPSFAKLRQASPSFAKLRQASPSFAKLRQASPSFAKLYLALALKKNQKKIKNTALAIWETPVASTAQNAKLRQASGSGSGSAQAGLRLRPRLRLRLRSFAKLRHASPSFAKLRQASPSFAKLYLALALKKNQKKIKNTALASWETPLASTAQNAKLQAQAQAQAQHRPGSGSGSGPGSGSGFGRSSFAKLCQALPSYVKLYLALALKKNQKYCFGELGNTTSMDLNLIYLLFRLLKAIYSYRIKIKNTALASWETLLASTAQHSTERQASPSFAKLQAQAQAQLRPGSGSGSGSGPGSGSGFGRSSFAKLRQALPSYAKLYLALALKKNQKYCFGCVKLNLTEETVVTE